VLAQAVRGSTRSVMMLCRTALRLVPCQAREHEDRTQVHPERLALYQQSMQGKLLEPGRQRREEHAGAAEERAEREARLKQAAGVRAGQPLTMAEQEHVSGKTSSHALQGYIATHVHIAEAQGDQLDSQCFIL
jgi:hypothetical protein